MDTLIESFYVAFQNNDAETMVNCYHDDVVFKDPAFGELKGERAKNMWRMFCSTDGERKITFSKIKTEGNITTAKWEARYAFSQTGRDVHNIIHAQFKFKDGKIIAHTDEFNLHSWAKQALGVKGLLLGGTRFFQKKLQTQTSSLLTKFENKATS